MATCSNCNKKIGFFSRHYRCLYCGRSLCADCINITNATETIAEGLRIIKSPHIDDILSNTIISTRKDVTCDICFKDKYIPMVNDIRQAIDTSGNVELVSIAYKGKKPINGNGIHIVSRWHADWDDCDYDLKVLARYRGCDIVMHVNKDRDVETWEERKDNGNGTYTRSRTIWKKTGVAYKRNK